MTGRYLEEFAPGQKFASGQLKVDRERIKSFAAEFDPQPFHLNEEAARGSGEETGRDLVEHGPEEVVVVLVNDRDGDRRPCEPARGVEAAETSADDDDAWEVRV